LRQLRHLGALPGDDVEREDLRRVAAVRRGSDVGVGHETPARAEGQVGVEVRAGVAEGRPVDSVRRVAAGRSEAAEPAAVGAHVEEPLPLLRERPLPDQLELVGDLEDHPRAVGRHAEALEHAPEHRAITLSLAGKLPTAASREELASVRSSVRPPVISKRGTTWLLGSATAKGRALRPVPSVLTVKKAPPGWRPSGLV
jgi:hypothetical protein